jgi:predicted Zn-dependent protease
VAHIEHDPSLPASGVHRRQRVPAPAGRVADAEIARIVRNSEAIALGYLRKLRAKQVAAGAATAEKSVEVRKRERRRRYLQEQRDHHPDRAIQEAARQALKDLDSE